jgi:lysyl-tRNA synthetase class 2
MIEIENILSESEIRLQKLKNFNKNPYPDSLEVNHQAIDLKKISEEKYNESYSLAGRLKAKREHGKSIFITIEDQTGIFQAYIKLDELNENLFELITKTLDVGDYIFVKGSLFKTKTGEITIRLDSLNLFAKCLHGLSDSFHGFDDLETKYRQRYLDLMINKEAKERFKNRSLIIRSIRNFLDSYNFLEVETPMLHPIPGGAAAKPFKTHHNALDMELFLRVSPELYLKRLVVGGLERVYEINRNFRNEGVSTRHNPEFTMIEFYMAHKDYVYIMSFVEELIRTALKSVGSPLVVSYGEHTIDFSKSFDRLSPAEAVLKYSCLEKDDLSEEKINQTLINFELQHFLTKSYNEKIFALFEKCAEKQLIQPTFIIDFPIELSPLSKRDAKNPNIAARFELFIAGMEISNGFNELNDPFDQKDRFEAQVTLRSSGDDEAMYYDADYITALEYGLPPTVGVGIGIDRLVMLATNTTTIKDVILFPSMRRK